MSSSDFSHLLINKISNTFEEQPFQIDGISTPAQGWTWGCNRAGLYTACSAEVEAILGITPQQFKGQPLVQFRLTEASSRDMQAAVKGGLFPLVQPVTFLDLRGIEIAAALTILTDTGRGLRGVVQIVPQAEEAQIPVTGMPVAEVVAPVEAPPVFEVRVAYQEADYQAASENLYELLERLRCLTPAIVKSAHSRIVSQSFVNQIEDTSQPPVEKDMLLGRVVLHYPEITIYTLEHCLEWGAKLEPSEQDKRILEEHQFASGFLSRLRSMRVPEEILLHQKNSIRVLLRIEHEKSNQLVLQFGDDQERTIENMLDLLLTDPEVLTPVLTTAIKHPQKSIARARRGVDYLIPR
ncbi:MAG: hypothetical protein ACK2UW_08685 [Anaerolineales bacterium]|jgi:hypothetical protein